MIDELAKDWHAIDVLWKAQPHFSVSACAGAGGHEERQDHLLDRQQGNVRRRCTAQVHQLHPSLFECQNVCSAHLKGVTAAPTLSMC